MSYYVDRKQKKTLNNDAENDTAVMYQNREVKDIQTDTQIIHSSDLSNDIMPTVNSNGDKLLLTSCLYSICCRINLSSLREYRASPVTMSTGPLSTCCLIAR